MSMGVRSACRGVKPSPIPRSEWPEIDQEQLAIIQDLRAEKHAALKSSRQLARFLCGISSPAAQRVRLSRHDAFGLLGGTPFAEILRVVETFA